MSKDRRLGRGLAALLGEPLDHPPSSRQSNPTVEFDGPRLHQPVDDMDGTSLEEEPTPSGSSHEGAIIPLSVHEIDDNPFQPRREFGEPEIASLAESLKEHDMLQPVLVRRVDNGWQLISGERRLRAAIQAGWTHVPARVRDADDRLVAELAIVENLQRKDLNPIEKALSFQRYLEEHQCTQDDLGKRLKIDRSTIANLLRLLELPEAVQSALRKGAISAGHARALLPLGDEYLQRELCTRIQTEQISVRGTERMVQEEIERQDEQSSFSGGSSSKSKNRLANAQLASLEQELRTAMGTKIELKQTGRGRGRIIIHFKSNDEFERIKTHLIRQ